MAADSPIAPPAARSGAVFCLTACLILLAAGAAANLAYLLGPHALDLSGDEAFYWEWARRPDISYYEKGPLIAYIIAASRSLLADWSQRHVGNEMLAVRVPAILLSAITGLGIYILAGDTLGKPRIALATVAITCTIPILAAGSILMTIDTPMALAWVWALICLHRALRQDRLAYWIAAGALIALGILAKYTMALIFPTFGLFLLLDPKARRLLRRPGPYVALMLGLAGMLPILVWSAQHGWVNFRHVAGQAGMSGGPGIDLSGLLVYIGGQAAVLAGVWFVGMVWALIDVWRRPCDAPAECHDPQSSRFLVVAAAVPWLVFLAFSVLTKIQPNWPFMALLTGTIVMTLWLGRRLRLPTPAERTGARAFIAAGVLLGGATVVVMHRSEWLMPVFAWMARGAPAWNLTPVARYDPTARLRGWSQLGAAVGQVLAKERTAGREPFLLAADYQLAAQIAFYTPGEPTVFSAQSALGGRMSQYDIWPNPVRDATQFIGRPCVYVGALHPALTGRDGRPPALTDPELACTVTHRVRGYPLQVWAIYTSKRFNGFPAPTPGVRRY